MKPWCMRFTCYNFKKLKSWKKIWNAPNLNLNLNYSSHFRNAIWIIHRIFSQRHHHQYYQLYLLQAKEEEGQKTLVLKFCDGLIHLFVTCLSNGLIHKYHSCVLDHTLSNYDGLIYLFVTCLSNYDHTLNFVKLLIHYGYIISVWIWFLH